MNDLLFPEEMRAAIEEGPSRILALCDRVRDFHAARNHDPKLGVEIRMALEPLFASVKGMHQALEELERDLTGERN